MDSDTKKAIAFLSALLVVVGLPVGCTAHQNVIIADAIKAGTDPILAACAFRSDGKDPLCMEAVRGQK